MKTCTKCGEDKDGSLFYPKRGACKSCIFQQNYAWQEKNREKKLEYQKASAKRQYVREKDKILERNQMWREQNREWMHDYNVQYHLTNPHITGSARRLREHALRTQTPQWADRDKIKAIYLTAKQLTTDTGTLYTVDHIVPLQGKLVSGLHVENNMQILTKSENSRKKHTYVDPNS